MSKSREFPTLAVVSTVTGILLCPIEQVYQVVDWMLSEDHFTHQLPRAAEEAKPYIVFQHPWLHDLALVPNDPALEMQSVDILTKHGTTLALTPVPNLEETA